MKRRYLLIPALALLVPACVPAGYTSAEVIYQEPEENVYVVPVERVVVVTREVLVNRGWVVFRVERAGTDRIIWARRGDDEIVRILATPHGERVAVRGLWEVRDRDANRDRDHDDHGRDHEDHGRHRGWAKRGAPRDIIADIDVRLRGR